MPNNPIRRAQLIAPFGVGALMVVQDGTSLISGGLDHWYKYEDGTSDSRRIDVDDFRVEEWRLQQLLNVDHFRLPPDFRDVRENVPNKFLKVPFLRFPQWHFCPGCRRLAPQPLTARGRIKCRECEEKNKKRYLAQVPFVAMCSSGHLQDFPWREWVHKSIQPECQRPLRIVATGGSSLGDQRVECDCEAKRSLSQITEASPDGRETVLSKSLDASGLPYLCQGKRPWLGTEESSLCSNPIRGSLRSASNLYYADVRSAIYLPRGNSEIPPELVSLLEEPPLSTLINLVSGLGTEVTPEILRRQHSALLREFSDTAVKGAIQIVLAGSEKKTIPPGTSVGSDDRETAFRREEFEALRTARNESLLIIKASRIDEYRLSFSNYFSRIMLISKLRETRALAGFTRIFPENGLLPLEERKAMLRGSLSGVEDDWLPAYIVYGEGIFLELDEQRLQAWEQHEDVLQRVIPLVRRYEKLEQNRKVRRRPLGPRFVLLHTLSHLIMNRLTFECGYSSAALRERLYVSNDEKEPMAGLLIYTAAGDSEGTMGGLVRMGQPGNLEPVIQQALMEARWCSADPVCIEMGTRGGQGPESCNLAACHNCALVPETACEEFNRFLDRAVVVGKVDERGLGYFDVNALISG